jgi:hypothetical protein
MLSGYVDENVKSAIILGLRQRGMDLVTAAERNQRQTDDEVLLATAASEDRLLLTNDADFLRIHAEWMAAGRVHSEIVFWHQDRPIGEAIRRIHQFALQTAANDAANLVKFVRRAVITDRCHYRSYPANRPLSSA